MRSDMDKLRRPARGFGGDLIAAESRKAIDYFPGATRYREFVRATGVDQSETFMLRQMAGITMKRNLRMKGAQK